jgi:hypothetical protein
MTASDPPKSSDHKYDIFVQEAIDYGILGSRHWSELKGWEQDEYIRACFEGESARAAAEERLQLLDRIAGTVADNLLGPFRQLDIEDGSAHYQPEDSARVDRVLSFRMVALKGTVLGDRLSVARNRRRSRPQEDSTYAEDPQLRFEYLDFQRTRGLEIMAEESFGGYAGVDPYRGAWNDWEALELQQAKEIQQSQLERRKHEVGAPATLRAKPTVPASTLATEPPLAPLSAATNKSTVPPASLARRIAWKFFPPPEVKSTLKAIDQYLSAAGACRLLVQRDAHAVASCAEIVVQRVRAERMQPDELALVIISNRLAEHLSSGAHHVYRGVLNMVGQDMRALHSRVLETMVRRGYLSEAEAKEDEALVRKEIQEVG